MLRLVAAIVVITFALGVSLRAADKPAAPVKPLKALMITGGCCHDYPNQKRILSEGISARANVEWTIVHEGDDDKARTHKISVYAKDDWAAGYDVIVHNECLGQVNDDAFVERIAKAHSEKGVPAVFLHCSTHSYRAAKTDLYRQTLGVSSFKHEKNRDFTVRNAKPEHPIMKGFPAEWLDKADELYMVEKFWPTATALGIAYGQDTRKDHPVIWTNEFGKAKVFSTTLGHGNHTMMEPVYLDLVTRGLLWVTGKLDDNGKPVSGYTAE